MKGCLCNTSNDQIVLLKLGECMILISIITDVNDIFK